MASDRRGAIESASVLNTKENSDLSLSRRRAGLLWFFVAAMIATHVFFLWRVRAQIVRGDPDFTVFYTAGKMLREGQGAQLYSSRAQQAVQTEFADNGDIRRGPLPYVHPPFEALFFLPLTLLPYPYAYALWNLINVGILFVVAVQLRKSLLSLKDIPVWQMVFLSLSFFPIFANFHQGQDAILLLLLVALSFRALDADADVPAGCWLALGLFKYHLILPLALILAFWRGRKFVLGFATMSSALVLISLGLVGWKGALQYPVYTWRVITGPAFGGIPPRQIPSLFGLLAGWQFSGQIGPVVQGSVAVLSLGLFVMVASLRKSAQRNAAFRLCVAAAVIASLLVGYSTNTYDLSLLVVSLAVIADYALTTGVDVRRLFVPAIPLFVSPLWFFLWMRWQRINVMAVFLLWWLFVLIAEIRRLEQIDAPLPASTVVANV
jgi:hypothetical protein